MVLNGSIDDWKWLALKNHEAHHFIAVFEYEALYEPLIWWLSTISIFFLWAATVLVDASPCSWPGCPDDFSILPVEHCRPMNQRVEMAYQTYSSSM